MDDTDSYVTEFYPQIEETPVTLATAALNMTTMDSEATLEYAEGGGGTYAGYAVPVQPRKQIAATKREVVGGSVPSAGFAKNYHPSASTNEQWRSNTILPNSKTPEPSMGHPHTSSSGSASSSKNYAYSSKPNSSQGTQTRYNLRPNSQAFVGRPGSQQQHHMQPRSVSRPETAGVEALMVAGKNVERTRIVPTPGMSIEEAQMEQQKQGHKITNGGNFRRG
ncbi:UNVERIFIED_CONTAM: hypothetical protein HDU68_003346 [Siphonaria sp. JEL0065]|nr:hypothetical protein HDU68_003346 [Siphonaria sp. JEL0065]